MYEEEDWILWREVMYVCNVSIIIYMARWFTEQRFDELMQENFRNEATTIIIMNVHYLNWYRAEINLWIFIVSDSCKYQKKREHCKIHVFKKKKLPSSQRRSSSETRSILFIRFSLRWLMLSESGNLPAAPDMTISSSQIGLVATGAQFEFSIVISVKLCTKKTL